MDPSRLDGGLFDPANDTDETDLDALRERMEDAGDRLLDALESEAIND